MRLRHVAVLPRMQLIVAGGCSNSNNRLIHMAVVCMKLTFPEFAADAA